MEINLFIIKPKIGDITLHILETRNVLILSEFIQAIQKLPLFKEENKY
jgi:hypothetical protein